MFATKKYAYNSSSGKEHKHKAKKPYNCDLTGIKCVQIRIKISRFVGTNAIKEAYIERQRMTRT